jgi:hypothetical protein
VYSVVKPAASIWNCLLKQSLDRLEHALRLIDFDVLRMCRKSLIRGASSSMRYFEWFGLDVCCDLDSRRLSSAREFSFRDANENKDTPLETLQTLGNKLIDTQESQLNLVILVVALALRAKGFE